MQARSNDKKIFKGNNNTTTITNNNNFRQFSTFIKITEQNKNIFRYTLKIVSPYHPN